MPGAYPMGICIPSLLTQTEEALQNSQEFECHKMWKDCPAQTPHYRLYLLCVSRFML